MYIPISISTIAAAKPLFLMRYVPWGPLGVLLSCSESDIALSTRGQTLTRGWQARVDDASVIGSISCQQSGTALSSLMRGQDAGR